MVSVFQLVEHRLNLMKLEPMLILRLENSILNRKTMACNS
jgi:hypothetical protein